MQLYLLRHGIAAPAGPGQSDEGRVLTPAGIDRMHRQAQAYSRLNLEIERLFTSTFARARQTAEIVGSVLGLKVEEAPSLCCGTTLADVEDLLSAAGNPDRALLVGHQPDLGQIIHTLTGASAAMRPGSLACLEADTLRPGRAYLAGLYDPDVIIQLVRGS